MMFKENLVVSVKAGGNYLIDKNNKVLMPFGTEYSLFFRNKDCRKVVIGPVTIDGSDILNGKRLVLDAGEDTLIKGAIRDTDESYSFKFIEKTNKISKYRGDDPEDGLICVSFQYEKIKVRGLLERRITSLGSIYSKNMNSSIIGSAQPSVESYSDISCSVSSGITVNGSSINHSFKTTTVGEMEEEKYNLVFGLYGYNDTGEIIQEAITPKTKLVCGTCGTRWAYTQKFCGECGTNLH